MIYETFFLNANIHLISISLSHLFFQIDNAAERLAKSKDQNDDNVKRVNLKFFLSKQGFYSCQQEGTQPFEVGCKHFYNCAKSEDGQLKGDLLICPEGSQFDDSIGKCKSIEQASASCNRHPPNPILFNPSALITQAKVAGKEFLESN